MSARKPSSVSASGVLFGIATAAFFVLVGMGIMALVDRGKVDPPVTADTPGTTEQPLSKRTIEIGNQIENRACAKGTNSCRVDSETPGVVSLTISATAVDEDGLRAAGERTGLWGAADVVRMTKTRALDGTQRTSDGRVSWTYHPDNGLQIVAEIK